jgi:hypothetical protein
VAIRQGDDAMQTDSTRQPYIDNRVPPRSRMTATEAAGLMILGALLLFGYALGLLTWLVWSVAT